MIIYHNLSATNSYRNYTLNQLSIEKTMKRLSSGLRVNSAADDASGLAVSEKMRAQIRGLNQAVRNTSDGISFIQTTEGYLQTTQDLLQRMRELAVQSSNGVYTDQDRMQIQVEVDQLIDEVDRIASHAQFNTLNILTGRFAKESETSLPPSSMWFHVGANMDHRERVHIGTMTANALGVRDIITGSNLNFASQDSANRSISVIDSALFNVSKQRADLGAYQNRLEYSMKSNMVGAESIQSAESLIRDADMALETIEFVRKQILTQTGTLMIGHANNKAQNVLRLLT